MEILNTKIDAVVISTPSFSTLNLFHQMFPLYFPRSVLEEAYSISELPEDTGNDLGESFVEERRIRIGIPGPLQDDEISSEQEDLTSIDASFTETRELTIGERRLQAQNQMSSGSDVAEVALLQYLKKAELLEHSQEYRELSRYKFIYKGGVDHANRNILVFCAAQLPGGYDPELLLCFLVRELDPYIRDRYVLLYVCSNSSTANNPSLKLLTEAWKIFNQTIESCLDQILVLHPGYLFKAAFLACWAWIPSHVWNGTVYLDHLQDLERYCNLQTLALPKYVKDYDKTLR